MQQGPTKRNIPSHSETVCNGCDFLHTTAGMRGHKKCSNNFACTHPDLGNEKMLMSDKKGRTIHFNHEGSCDTPSWCPVLNRDKLTDKVKKVFPWECIVNHLPDWTEQLSTEINAIITDTDYRLVDALMVKYNELIDKENDNTEDGHSLYGVEDEKQELIDTIVKIYTRYKEEAIRLKLQTPNP